MTARVLETLYNCALALTTAVKSIGLPVSTYIIGLCEIWGMAEIYFLWQFSWKKGAMSRQKKQRFLRTWRFKEIVCILMVIATGVLTIILPDKTVGIAAHMSAPLYSEYAYVKCANTNNSIVTDAQEIVNAGDALTWTVTKEFPVHGADAKQLVVEETFDDIVRISKGDVKVLKEGSDVTTAWAVDVDGQKVTLTAKDPTSVSGKYTFVYTTVVKDNADGKASGMTDKDEEHAGDTPRPGDVIAYTFTIKNDGREPLHDIQIKERLAQDFPELSIEPIYDPALSEGLLQPGETVTITVPYTLTQEDIDAGKKAAEESNKATREKLESLKETIDSIVIFLSILGALIALASINALLITKDPEKHKVFSRYVRIGLCMCVLCWMMVKASSMVSTTAESVPSVSTEGTYGYALTLENTTDVTITNVTLLTDTDGSKLHTVQEEWWGSTDPLTDTRILSPGERAYVHIKTNTAHDHFSARGIWKDNAFANTMTACVLLLSAMYLYMALSALVMFVRSVGTQRTSTMYWVVRVAAFGAMVYTMAIGTRASVLMTTVSVLLFMALGIAARARDGALRIYAANITENPQNLTEKSYDVSTVNENGFSHFILETDEDMRDERITDKEDL